jgi:hypothetical protein
MHELCQLVAIASTELSRRVSPPLAPRSAVQQADGDVLIAVMAECLESLTPQQRRRLAKVRKQKLSQVDV